MEGGTKAGLKSVNYKEVRKYSKGSTVVTFYFVTRCYGEYMESIIATLEKEPPDVIIMNSCLWDLCRYGKNANSEFKTNINELLEAIGLVTPYDSERMFIWNASLPVIDTSKSTCTPYPRGFQLENSKVRNANMYVRDQMVGYGDHFIFLDLYDTFYCHLDHRTFDGVHWDSFAHRKITHLLLTKISVKWDVELPAKENGPTLRTLKPPVVSTPPMTSRYPRHSVSPYERPSPSNNRAVYHPRPLSAHLLFNLNVTRSGAPALRQNLVGPTGNIPWARPRFSFPLNPLTGPFLKTPFVFGAGPSHWRTGPSHWRTGPLNVHNGPLLSPEVNWLVNRTLPPNAGKRKLEQDECSAPSSDYKRPRRFMT